MRKPVSVTLEHDNLLWLKGQAAATERGSVSEVLDQIVTEARLAGRAGSTSVRSVRDSIDLPDDDPDLLGADAYIRYAFDRSVTRPMLVRETAGRVPKRRKSSPAKTASRG